MGQDGPSVATLIIPDEDLLFEAKNGGGYRPRQAMVFRFGQNSQTLRILLIADFTDCGFHLLQSS